VISTKHDLTTPPLGRVVLGLLKLSAPMWQPDGWWTVATIAGFLSQDEAAVAAELDALASAGLAAPVHAGRGWRAT